MVCRPSARLFGTRIFNPHHPSTLANAMSAAAAASADGRFRTSSRHLKSCAALSCEVVAGAVRQAVIQRPRASLDPLGSLSYFVAHRVGFDPN